MSINRNHLLVAFIATLASIVILVATSNGGDLGGRLSIVDGLMGLLLILGGAVAGAHTQSN